jgi:hypothetical protein
MGSRWGLLLVLLCAVTGCKGVRGVRLDPTQPLALTVAEAPRIRAQALQWMAEQPRTLERMRRAAEWLTAVARVLPADYDAQWQAAAAAGFVAEYDPVLTNRIEFAKRGLALARRGRELQPDRVEAHYWYALNVGFLADADRGYGLRAVGEMEEALQRALALDAAYDYGGPARVLGVLHLRTPAPPVSLGSARKGLRFLERARELAPEYPENWLYLAEALRDNHRLEEARALARQVVAAPVWPDRQFESAGWKRAAEQLLATIETR